MASRNRHSTAQPTPGRQSTAPGTQSRAALLGELPPYKKPSHPLNVKAQDKLKTIYDRRTLASLQEFHTKVETQITDAAKRINDDVTTQQAYVDRRREKRWEKGQNLDEQEGEEQKLENMKEKAAELTRKLEIDMRAMIDGGIAAQRMNDTLRWLQEHAPDRLNEEFHTQTSQRQTQQSQSQRRRRRQQDQDGDEDMDDEAGSSPGPTPLDGSRVALTGPYEMFKDRQTKKHDEYTSISHFLRYAKNNSYIGFKDMVHDAQYGNDGVQLPRPETWFTERGSPAPGVTATQGDDDDDDIVVDKATISVKCPLTLQKFREPLSSTKCRHSFEKTAIIDMIRASSNRLGGQGVRGQGVRCVECPVAGCEQLLSVNDLRVDEILIRKIKRIQAQEAAAEDDSDDEAVTAPGRNQSQVIGSSDAIEEEIPHRHKREVPSPAPMTPPTQIVDLGDPSDEDDDDDEAE